MHKHPHVPKKAVVLAAGLGNRMRPLTDHIPKPMVEVAGATLIDRVLKRLAAIGITEIIVNSHYKAEILERYLTPYQQDSSFPTITISREETLLETGGGVAKVLHLLQDEPFYVINSDILWLDNITPALLRLASAWDDAKMDALLLVHDVTKAVGYDGCGDFHLYETGELERGNGTSFPYVFTGIQILSSRLFSHIPGDIFSLNVLYARNRQPDGRLNRVYGLAHDGDWLHIGTPEGVILAEKFLEENASNR